MHLIDIHTHIYPPAIARKAAASIRDFYQLDTPEMDGTAQTLLEKGIRPEQMLARVSAVCRKGKLLRKGDFWWNFFETAWLRMLSARPFVRQLYSRFHHTIK